MTEYSVAQLIFKTMFGKNYDKNIENLWEGINSVIKQSNKSTEILDKLILNLNELQEDILQIAKTQAQHKQIISFLMHHSSVDEDSKDDFLEMLEKIKDLEDISKGKK